MADASEAIDRGLEACLRLDPELRMLAPGGVWFTEAPQAVTGIYIVWMLQAATDHRTHDRRGWERALYLVKAVGRTTEAIGVVSAAARLRALLEGASWPAEGYTVIRCERDEENARVAYLEVDGQERWQHRGAIWDVWAAPLRI